MNLTAVFFDSGDRAQQVMRVILLVFGGLLAYFLPAIVAHGRKHNNKGAIAVLNLLAGWTVVGWIASLVWAATSNVQQRQVSS